ncbi:MAG TPA: hypothetical protein VJW51_06125 [Candidatus Acidoferrales bacterium]|nr:hypothetical protein [Candidatus Acidoferrales bacterium]
MTKPPANVLELPFHERAAMAMKAAIEGVILKNAASGGTIFVMRDGKIVEVSNAELRQMAARILAE